MFNDKSEMYTNSSFISINLSHIQHNYQNVIKKLIHPETKIIAMVKSNAYGHGIVEVSRSLEEINTDYLGVFSIEEVRWLKKAQINLPIIVFGVPSFKNLQPRDLEQTSLIVSSQDELNNIMHWTELNHQSLKVHIKIDTGMGRLGFFPDDAFKVLSIIKKQHPLIKIEGICTHFADSSSADRSYTLWQGEKFNQLINELKQQNINIPLIHAANSGAILHYPEFHYTAVRPGILLYGAKPDENEVAGLKPALSFYSYISNIKTLPAHSYVSYGRTFQTQKKTTVAIIPVGYADGIPLGLSNKGYIILKDKICPIIGSVCMNQFLVDITNITNARIGDQVTIIGNQPNHEISINEMANLANTIPYEIMCRLSVFQNRQYLR